MTPDDLVAMAADLRQLAMSMEYATTQERRQRIMWSVLAKSLELAYAAHNELREAKHD